MLPKLYFKCNLSQSHYLQVSLPHLPSEDVRFPAKICPLVFPLICLVDMYMLRKCQEPFNSLSMFEKLPSVKCASLFSVQNPDICFLCLPRSRGTDMWPRPSQPVASSQESNLSEHSPHGNHFQASLVTKMYGL